MQRRLGVAAVLLIAVLGLSIAASAAVASEPGAADSGASAVSLDAPTVQPEPNETDPLHEHPERAEGQGDDGRVAAWLLDRLEGGVEESAIQLSQGQYEAGREVLGEEYEGRLEQYVDVAGDTNWETEDESDPRTRDEVAAEEFQAIHETQTELADLLVEYEETLAAYEAARDAGNEERALELARDLVDLADRIEALGGELDARYARVEAVVDRDLSPAAEAISERTTETRNETARIASDAFSETSLSVEVVDATVSATDPLRVEGRLVDEHGDPIAGATIAVADPVAAAPLDAAGTDDPVGSGATTTVETAADGTFELEHRPVYVPLSVEHLTVEYRPERLAPHRAASETVDVDVQQVEGEVRVANEPSTVQFGETVDVGLVASADGEPVSGVPFRLTVGGAHAIGVTDESGAVRLATTVPRDVPAGESTVSIDVPVEDWSVAFEPTSSSVEVLETETELTARANGAGERVELSGQLTTADGTPVDGAPVEIAGADGEPVSAVAQSNGNTSASNGVASDDSDGAVLVRTDDDGRYSVTVDASAVDEALVARYAEPDSNLADAEATASIASGGGGAGGGGALAALRDALATPLVLGAASVLALLVGGVAVLRRRDPPTDDADEATVAPDGVADEPAEPIPESYGATDLLEAADEALSDSPAEATVLAYGAGREALGERVEATPDATHWEFYETCREAGLDEEELEAVRVLTERYETAAYAPEPIDAQDARDAIAAAEHVR